MNVSTNLPYGVKAIAEHLANGQPLTMNVSTEADAAYVAEKSLRNGPVVLKRWPMGVCTRCHEVIYNAPFLSNSEPGQFCSHECRDENKQGRTARVGRPRLTAKERATSVAKRLAYQKNLMRERRDPVLAENSPQTIENANVADPILAS